MTHYILRRLGIGIVTLLLASLVIFFVMAILPGDPARLMLGMEATEDAVQTLRRQMGLDRPLLTQYLGWMGGMLTGDLGRSFTYSSPVADLIRERIVVTAPLALIALVLSTIIAIPVGLYAASRRGRAADTLAMGAAQVGIAVPSFWFGLMLIYIFAVHLRLLPANGFPGWDAGLWPAIRGLILPSLALALPQAAILSRITRSSLLDTLNEDYIRTARAKGMPRRYVLWHHALRNALIPVITVIGIQFGFLVTGAIVIEQVFSLPGLGRFIFQSINQRDLISVQGTVMVIVAFIILLNLLVDLTYAAIDPRLRLKS